MKLWLCLSCLDWPEDIFHSYSINVFTRGKMIRGLVGTLWQRLVVYRIHDQVMCTAETCVPMPNKLDFAVTIQNTVVQATRDPVLFAPGSNHFCQMSNKDIETHTDQIHSKQLGVSNSSTELQVFHIYSCILIYTIKSLCLFPHTGGGMLPSLGLVCWWVHGQLTAAGWAATNKRKGPKVGRGHLSSSDLTSARQEPSPGPA